MRWQEVMMVQKVAEVMMVQKMGVKLKMVMIKASSERDTKAEALKEQAEVALLFFMRRHLSRTLRQDC